MPSVSISSLRTGASPNPKYFVVALIALFALVGCTQEIKIRKYKVAKSDSRPRNVARASESKVVEQQMLGAIVPNGPSAWFFKLMGDPDAVSRNQEDFASIVKSIEFKAGTPSWKLSEGWTQQIEQGITYARLLKEADGLTATVTQLPVGDSSSEEMWQKYVADNVNRWRGQLALDAQTWEKIEPDLQEFSTLSKGPAKAYFVSLKGEGRSGGSSPPFAGMMGNGGRMPGNDSSSTSDGPNGDGPNGDGSNGTQGPSSGPAGASASSQNPAKTPFEFETPSGWEETDVSSSQMRLLAFEIKNDEATAEVTLIAARGAIQDNLRMWFGQATLEGSREQIEQVISAADEVSVNEKTGKVFWIDGAKGESSQSILVADIPWREGESLFVKLKGDFALVESERERFMGFLKSLKW